MYFITFTSSESTWSVCKTQFQNEFEIVKLQRVGVRSRIIRDHEEGKESSDIQLRVDSIRKLHFSPRSAVLEFVSAQQVLRGTTWAQVCNIK